MRVAALIVASSCSRVSRATPRGARSIGTTRIMASFIDIGANLLDPMFQGVYREKSLHGPDLDYVLARAKEAGCDTIMVTAGTPEESLETQRMCREKASELWPALRTTVGIHPTHAAEYWKEDGNGQNVLEQLIAAARTGKDCIVAVGECGLDRAREHFAPFAVQEKVFEVHFDLADHLGLPLFIHSRDCEDEMFNMLSKHVECLNRHGAVVHSFDGTLDFATRVLALSARIYLGINGCSLKTEENLAVVKELPLDRLMIESDAPWCEIKATSAASKLLEPGRWSIGEVNKPEKLKGKEGTMTVKSRNEPKNTLDVARVIAALKGMDANEVASVVLQNTRNVFFPPT